MALLEIRNVTRRFGDFVAVDNVKPIPLSGAPNGAFRSRSSAI